jgi:hypothetical protein
MKQYPSVEYLRQCLRYENGKLFWLARPREHFQDDRAHYIWNLRWPGKEAGYLQKSGPDKEINRLVRIVTINSRGLSRSRVVWAMHKDEWPVFEIDHKNRDPLDDRIENLRPATRSQNTSNVGLRKDNTSGYKGVAWNKRNRKWVAYVGTGKKVIYLGYFDDPAEAHAAYVKAASQYHGDFFCAG